MTSTFLIDLCCHMSKEKSTKDQSLFILIPYTIFISRILSQERKYEFHTLDIPADNSKLQKIQPQKQQMRTTKLSAVLTTFSVVN